jgi:predicted nucleic acid-binding protein
MSEIPNYVVDASVAVSWLLPSRDEPYAELSAVVEDHYFGGNIDLVAPYCLHYEVGHALVRSVRRSRLASELASQSWMAFWDWEMRLSVDRTVMGRAWRLSQMYGVSFYDASYLALAEVEQRPLIHADERLRNTLAGRFPYELWIEDYR